MTKRRGNPNWGKAAAPGPVVVSPTSFERTVDELALSPDQYVDSDCLREWARSNKDSKYVPEKLLAAWGFEVDSNS